MLGRRPQTGCGGHRERQAALQDDGRQAAVVGWLRQLYCDARRLCVHAAGVRMHCWLQLWAAPPGTHTFSGGAAHHQHQQQACCPGENRHACTSAGQAGVCAGWRSVQCAATSCACLAVPQCAVKERRRFRRLCGVPPTSLRAMRALCVNWTVRRGCGFGIAAPGEAVRGVAARPRGWLLQRRWLNTEPQMCIEAAEQLFFS